MNLPNITLGIRFDPGRPLACDFCGADRDDAVFVWCYRDPEPHVVEAAAILCYGMCDERMMERAGTLGMHNGWDALKDYRGAAIRGDFDGPQLLLPAANGRGALAMVVQHLSMGLYRWTGDPLRRLLAVATAAGQLMPPPARGPVRRAVSEAHRVAAERALERLVQDLLGERAMPEGEALRRLLAVALASGQEPSVAHTP